MCYCAAAMNMKTSAALSAFLLLMLVGGRAGATITPSGVSFSANEGTLFNGVVATFTQDDPSATAGSFAASIDWGDGTSATAATTISQSMGVFSVTGQHTFAEQGTYTVTVTITDTDNLTTGTAKGSATVTDVLAVTADSFTVAQGTAFNGTIATFTDSDPASPIGEYSASIDWGDGNTTAASSVSGNAGSFTVGAQHTYTLEGSYSVTVTVVKTETKSSITMSGKATATVTDVLAVTADDFSIVEGMQFSGTVATFTDSDTTTTAVDFSAVIDWGDGNTTAASTVSGGSGAFTVTGAHTYAHEGSYTFTVTITESGNLATAAAMGTATVTDVLAGSPLVFPASAKLTFKGAVATFTDTEPTNVAADFTALIQWGDGTTGPGTIAGGNGAFTVSGTHIYPSAGTFPVMVTLTEIAPGTATATVTSTAEVTDSIVSIPALSFSGLLVLGLSLAAAGFCLLRKG
jgi:hypothetical protein